MKTLQLRSKTVKRRISLRELRRCARMLDLLRNLHSVRKALRLYWTRQGARRYHRVRRLLDLARKAWA